jgi:hypothetical protein
MERMAHAQLEDILEKILEGRILDRKFSMRYIDYEAFMYDKNARTLKLRNVISYDYIDISIDDYPHIFKDDNHIMMFTEDEYSKYEQGQYAVYYSFSFIKKASVEELVDYCNNVDRNSSLN